MTRNDVICKRGNIYISGHHAPAKPNLSVLGRHEIQVEWDIPKEPLNRITSYEVKVNGEV